MFLIFTSCLRFATGLPRLDERESVGTSSERSEIVRAERLARGSWYLENTVFYVVLPRNRSSITTSSTRHRQGKWCQRVGSCWFSDTGDTEQVNTAYLQGVSRHVAFSCLPGEQNCDVICLCEFRELEVTLACNSQRRER